MSDDREDGEGGEAGEAGEDGPVPSGFDGLVLDDEFVQGATRSEPPARHRAPTRLPLGREAKRSRRRRRQRPGRRSGNGGRLRAFGSWWGRHPFTVAGVVVVLLLAASAARGHGPLAPGSGFLQAIGLSPRPGHGVPATTIPTDPTPPGAGTPTTLYSLGDRNFQPGDCVTWDQTATGENIQTAVVPCTSPHLVEIVGPQQLSSYAPDAPYPGESQWTQIDSTVCGPPAATYLGYGLDPQGRFSPEGIRPVESAWTLDDRKLWCGISARVPGDPSPNVQALSPFTGVVRGQDQTFLYPVGTCFGVGPQGQSGGIVPCQGVHGYEITGTVTVPTQVTQLPQTPAAWSAAVGATCDNVAVQYHHGSLPAGVFGGWRDITQIGWDAGERTVQCTVGWYDANRNNTTGTTPLQG